MEKSQWGSSESSAMLFLPVSRPVPVVAVTVGVQPSQQQTAGTGAAVSVIRQQNINKQYLWYGNRTLINSICDTATKHR